MTHYHVERKHDDNEAFEEFDDAVSFIVAELSQGLNITSARGDLRRCRDIVGMMSEYLELDSWEVYNMEGVAYKEMGDRSWNIRSCNDYDCRRSGGSW